MKPAPKLGAVLTLSILLSSAVAGAAEESPRYLFDRANRLEVGAFLGAFFPSSKHEFYDFGTAQHQKLQAAALELGLRLGYWPFKMIGAEGEAALLPTKTAGGQSATLNALRLHGVLALPMRVTPFALWGVGTMGVRSANNALGNDQDLFFHWGVGAKLNPRPDLAVRLDLRHLVGPRAFSVKGKTPHWEALAGVSWVLDFADKKKAEEPPPPPPEPKPEPVVEKSPVAPAVVIVEKDTDNDGMKDSVDKCPNEAEDFDGFEDSDGCPDPDNDKDGLLDAADKCPNLAEDKDGFEDTDGCPDDDNDKDGIPDAKDKCPNDPGVAERDGCPEPDTDGDGLIDRLDNCPFEAGPPQNSGCQAKQLVKLTADKIEIMEKVFFKTGKDAIEAKSFPLLNNIATVLKAHAEIKKLRIEGHTDNVGKADFNKTLSQKRADAVVSFLVSAGVDAARLEGVGFGPDKPIAPNTAEKGRSMNRRVEFNIISGD